MSYVKVVLQRRVPRQFSELMYEADLELGLKIGDIVAVPFGKQTAAAVIMRLGEKKPNIATKKVLSRTAFALTAEQIKMINNLGIQLHCPLNALVNYYAPKKIWEYALKGMPAPEAGKREIEASADFVTNGDKDIEKFVNTLFIQSSPVTCLPTFAFEKTNLPRRPFYAAIQNAVEGQILILVPEKFHADSYKDIGTPYHSELSESTKMKTWIGVKNGSIKTIIGTRAALFLPFRKLSAIVMDAAESQNYQEQRFPHFHAGEIAELLHREKKIPFVAVSSAPTLKLWEAAQDGRYVLSVWGRKVDRNPVTVIDMALEWKFGNATWFSERLMEKIAERLVKREQVLLFMNQKGTASALACSECLTVARCETCNLPLAVHERKYLACHRCKTRRELPENCGNCGGPGLKALGLGTEGIEEEMKSRFAKAKIIRLDAETTSGKGARNVMLSAENLQKANIIVATQIIDKPLPLDRLTLAAAVMPDPLLQIPDMQAGENLMRILTHLRLQVQHGELIVQTFLPEHAIYQALSKNRLEDFYAQELAARAVLKEV